MVGLGPLVVVEGCWTSQVHLYDSLLPSSSSNTSTTRLHHFLFFFHRASLLKQRMPGTTCNHGGVAALFLIRFASYKKMSELILKSVLIPCDLATRDDSEKWRLITIFFFKRWQSWWLGGAHPKSIYTKKRQPLKTAHHNQLYQGIYGVWYTFKHMFVMGIQFSNHDVHSIIIPGWFCPPIATIFMVAQPHMCRTYGIFTPTLIP